MGQGNLISVNMGDLMVEKAPIILKTDGVGSCVVLCLYNRMNQIGGLAHIMLPKNMLEIDKETPEYYKYADVAIKVMVNKLEQMGVNRTTLTAKLVGGANMFPGIQGRSEKVGERNIKEIRDLLTAYNIKINAEHVGGTVGRSVVFDLGNGLVSIQISI